MRAHVIALAFRCRIIAGDLTPSSETSDFRWASPEGLRSITTEVFAVRLLDGLDYTGAPAVRHHDGERLL
jgi:hypothetical protein